LPRARPLSSLGCSHADLNGKRRILGVTSVGQPTVSAGERRSGRNGPVLGSAAREVRAHGSAEADRGTRPMTEAPLPDMTAPSAPASRRAPFTRPWRDGPATPPFEVVTHQRRVEIGAYRQPCRLLGSVAKPVAPSSDAHARKAQAVRDSHRRHGHDELATPATPGSTRSRSPIAADTRAQPPDQEERDVGTDCERKLGETLLPVRVRSSTVFSVRRTVRGVATAAPRGHRPGESASRSAMSTSAPDVALGEQRIDRAHGEIAGIGRHAGGTGTIR
jgi:hypothetical protein